MSHINSGFLTKAVVITSEADTIFSEKPFEKLFAVEQVDDKTVLQMLDYPAYFNLLKKPIPDGVANILNELKSSRLIVQHDR